MVSCCIIALFVPDALDIMCDTCALYNIVSVRRPGVSHLCSSSQSFCLVCLIYQQCLEAQLNPNPGDGSPFNERRPILFSSRASSAHVLVLCAPAKLLIPRQLPPDGPSWWHAAHLGSLALSLRTSAEAARPSLELWESERERERERERRMDLFRQRNRDIEREGERERDKKKNKDRNAAR